MQTLIEKLERLYYPDNAGIDVQSVADNNMAIVKAIAVVRQHVPSQLDRWGQQANKPTPDSDRALSLLRSVCTPLDHNLEIQPGCATHRCIQAFLGGEQPSGIRVMGGAGSDSSSPGLQGEIPENGPNEPTPPATLPDWDSGTPPAEGGDHV